MRFMASKHISRRRLILLLGICVLLFSAMTCQSAPVKPSPPPPFGSTGQCQAHTTAPTTTAATGRTLSIAVEKRPNITLCHLAAQDGTLLRHEDLTLHGDIMGQTESTLYVQQLGEAQRQPVALCAISNHDGTTRWCRKELAYAGRDFLSAQGLLYFLGGSSIASVTVVNEQDGRILTSYRLPSDGSPQMVVSGILYVKIFRPRPTPIPFAQAGDTIESVCALQARSGQQLWCQTFETRHIESMAAFGNSLYLQATEVSETYYGVVFLYALDALSGQIRWNITLDQHNDGNFFQQLPPIFVEGDNLYASIAKCDPYGCYKPFSVLYALRTTDGIQRWRKETDPGTTIKTLMLAQNMLYTTINKVIFESLTSTTGTYVSHGEREARSATNGSVLWSQKSPFSDQSFWSNLRVDHGMLFLLQGRALWVGQGASGKTLWSKTSCASSTPSKENQCYWDAQALVWLLGT